MTNQSKKDWDTVIISILDLADLKILSKNAVRDSDESFIFKEREILTSFAKYWIQYIETQFEKLGEI